MSQDPAAFRPKRFPAPEFPPRKPRLFATTPPVVFTALLGVSLLQPVTRHLLTEAELPVAAADLAGGVILGIWAFLMFALIVKIARRPSVITEDFRVMVSRDGLFSASAACVVAAMILHPFAPGFALWLTAAALAAHIILVGVFIALTLRKPTADRSLDPGWQLISVTPLIAGLFLVDSGYSQLSLILYMTMAGPVVLVLLQSLADLWRKRAPAPLRPMFVLNIGALALLLSLAIALGHQRQSIILAIVLFAAVMAMLGAVNWLTISGFTPLWGALAWPLVAVIDPLVRSGALVTAAMLLLPVSVFALVVCWKILRLWPKGKLAAMTNSAGA